MRERKFRQMSESPGPTSEAAAKRPRDTDAPSSAAIVPAAGQSRRMGRPKPLLVIGSESLLARVVRALRAGGVNRVLVVAPPADSPEVHAIVAEGQAAGAEVIVPPVRPPEMRDSVEIALERLAHDRPPSHVVLAPGDCPGATPEIVAALLDVADRQPDKLVVPVFQARRGHPVVLPWELAVEIPNLPPGAGVNGLVSRHSGRLIEVAVSSADVCADLDTLDDVRRWLDRERAVSVSNAEPDRSASPAPGQREGDPAEAIHRIRLEVRLFAMARERAGESIIAVDVPLGACVADLRAEIARRLPVLAPLLPRTMIAVDEEYADDDRVLAAGSRVAVIPPVSGGSQP